MHLIENLLHVVSYLNYILVMNILNVIDGMYMSMYFPFLHIKQQLKFLDNHDSQMYTLSLHMQMQYVEKVYDRFSSIKIHFAAN